VVHVYLNGCTQFVRCNRSWSVHVLVIIRVSQGSNLGLSFFWCIQLTYCGWLNVTAFIHMGALTTRKSTVSVPRQSLTHSKSKYLRALMTSRCTWVAINFNSTYLWCSLSWQQHQIPQCPVHVGEDFVITSTTVMT